MFKKLFEYVWILTILAVLVVITIYTYNKVYEKNIGDNIIKNERLKRGISSLNEAINEQLDKQ